jgi:glycosyltransferase involved in cell wall biosynthesis
MTDSRRPEQIKVCFVSPKAYPLFDTDANGVIGGAEVDLYLLATELAKDPDYNVSCITADYGQPKTQKIENVTIIKSLNFKQNQITGAMKIWKALKSANADIYKMKTPSPGVPLVAAFCKLYKRHFTYRGASEREFNGVYLSKHPVLGRLFMQSIRSAGLLTVQNQSDAAQLRSLMSVEASVIPNGHRLLDLADTVKDTILWVGRSAPVKRPELFLELAKELPTEKFTMICQRATGDNNYSDLVAQAKQIPNFRFIEQVPFNEIDTYFRDAKILVNTSDSEGFPNVFIQACKVATPILTLNVNPDGFLDKYACGVCCGGDMKKMSEQLMAIISTPDGMAMGKNGREYVEQTHDIATVIKRYKEIFEAF